MNILDYTRQFCLDIQRTKKTKYQFGVLAFDLGEIGPIHIHRSLSASPQLTSKLMRTVHLGRGSNLSDPNGFCGKN